jgi:glycosyltransferase involved in cell wall biosynthesis
MPSPFFSIIIPSLNSSATIQRCLHSIVNQTFVDFEVVIADGCSQDSTVSKVSAFQDKRIALASAPDSGLFDGMSRGIGRSLGRWVLVLGSDDELFCEYTLEQAHYLLMRYASSCMTGAYGNAFIRGSTGWSEDGETYMGITDLPLLIRKNICQQAIFYRGELIRRRDLQFDKHLGGNGGDHFCNLRLWLLQPFVHIPMTVSVFHAGGASSYARSCFSPAELLAHDVWPHDIVFKSRVRFVRIRLLLAWKLPLLYKVLLLIAVFSKRLMNRA